MNKLSFSLRATAVSWWVVCGLSIGLPLSAVAQSATPPIRQADFIVAVVNSEPITNQEVRAISQRLQREAAAQGRPVDEAQARSLALEQLINDKAQLQQARDVGIRIDAEALSEAEAVVARNNQLTVEALHQRLLQEGLPLATFREQLSKQLLLTRLREREVEARIRVSETEVSQFLQEQRQLQAARGPVELNLAMILVAVPENSTEVQIQALAERAQDIARRARGGEDFAALAKTYSQAADLGSNGGAMGLRLTDRYPDLFLQATQALPVGGVSDVVRSGAGFHVLKVLQREQAPATLTVTQTRARHILLRPGQALTQAQAMSQLVALRTDIVSGQADFAEAARRLSQDGSAAQGGDLGWASPGMFVPEFEQVMNRLRPGQVAEPLVSRFGVHLIEVTERREAPMSDEEQRNLARNVLREKKLEEAYASWAEDLRGRAYVEMREAPL
jgi:peptidyl-prolyl cis-trans isomerase SurA